MREGGKKKHLGKKNIEPIFEKVNEGDQIKKTLDTFLEKVMRACFFWNVFLSPDFFFFFGNQQQYNARAGQKKTTYFCFGNALPKSNARAHLKQRK